MNDLSIVIVSYNTKELTLSCLESICHHKPDSYSLDIFVVDNASSDGTVEAIAKQFPQVKLIANEKNLGYAAANNQAIFQTNADYILLLNSDTLVLENCLEAVIDFMRRHPEVGASGCKLVLPDGSLDLACKRSFPTPETSFYHAVGLSKRFPQHKKFGRYNLSYLNENEIHEVDCLVGAFMMVRRKVIEEIGGLDESFFLFGEDIDWCYRIKEAGWKVVYYPKAVAIHYKGSSCKKNIWKSTYEFHRAMLIFYNKHYKYKYNLLIRTLIYVGIGTKLFISLVTLLFRPGRGDNNSDKRKPAADQSHKSPY